MKINLIFNRYIPDYKKALETVEKALLSYNAEFKTFDLENMECFGDISFAIGGDGTLLRAARFYSKFKIPVLGINVGRLGFLAQAGINEINGVIEAVLENQYKTEERIMLQSGEYIALNDFVIKGQLRSICHHLNGLCRRCHAAIIPEIKCPLKVFHLLIRILIRLQIPIFRITKTVCPKIKIL